MNPHVDTENDALPSLQFSFRWFNIVRYIVFLLILNLAVPCILFYVLRTRMFYVSSDQRLEEMY